MSSYQFCKNSNRDLNISIDKNEVLRYLGYNSPNVDKLTDELIEDAILEIKEVSDTKYIYGIYPIDNHSDSVLIKGTSLELLGNDIKSHLEDSYEVAIIAVTLGFAVEKKIRYYSMTDLTKGIIFDACATTYIEGLCDYVENEVKEIAQGRGYNITFRYSPGYGDLPIDIQENILKALNAEKLIGLMTTETSILLPRKSVTAFIGFTKKIPEIKNDCQSCNLYGNCEFSREGCGNYVN